MDYNKIIAIGDLHGDFHIFVNVLLMCNLIGGGSYSRGPVFDNMLTFKLKIDGKGSSSQISKTSPPTTFPFAPPKPPPPTDEQVAEMIEQIREDRSSEDS